MATDPPDACDVVVVGAGIVGLAVARELRARRPDLSLAVLEKEPTIGMHQTSRNSGVVHAGIYYAPGSLKAQLCIAGAHELYGFCARKGIAVERCGKLIVATEARAVPRLDELERRGRANGVPGLRRLAGAEIADVEPHAVGVAALHSPASGITDFRAVAGALADELTEEGAAVATGREVTSATAEQRRLRIVHTGGATTARFAVFCAGAWSDRLAVRAGAPSDPRIVPFRGAYLRLRPERRALVRALIYPVPDPALPFLGAHLTRRVSGDVLVGPTALLAPGRDAYRLTRARPGDVAATLAWPGTWRMARRWWRTGIRELRHAASRRELTKAVAPFLPELEPGDLTPAFVGIRAQAVRRDGSFVDDFVFSRTERALHVRNAPSPAATSAFAIAPLVAGEILEAL